MTSALNNPLFWQQPPVLERKRVVLLLEYHGEPYFGSQYQPAHPTVQGALIEAIEKLGVKPYSMVFAGRTDAGVHAKGQVLHFDMAADALRHIDDFRLALNVTLPESISLRNWALNVPQDFHAQRGALYKWYRYKMYLGGQRSVWMPGDSHFLRNGHKPLDIGAMQAAAKLLEGKHRFKSFQCTGSRVFDDLCDIMMARLEVVPAEDGDFSDKLLIFDIVGDRFLYKMVRTIVGQLLQIGLAGYGDHNPASILRILAQRDRRQSAGVVPANGLSLMAVRYPDEPGKRYHFFKDDPLQAHLTRLLKEEATSELSPNPHTKSPVHPHSADDLSQFFGITALHPETAARPRKN